jgi:hypothetical protein
MTSLRKIKLKLKLKLKLSTPKPRNPLVVPALKRKGGAHEKSKRSERQQARRNIAQALKERG